ncbi:MAX dimerization protein MGA a [Centroberyx affinis]|uniref:MAX dimerization protein MGA a n=1 Tax=Centroberyx affinis TaxID=166261 RepID=UPI003A5C2657
MASKKKQKGMVFHEEGATAPTAAPAAAPPPKCFVVLKPGKASEGGLEQGDLVTNEEADMMIKSNMYSTKEVIKVSAILPMMKHPTGSNPQSDNLSPDSICKGIKVTLDNNSMWNEFFRCKTEMILTKQGSRMFPYCRFRISGLEPSKKYSLIMDIQPVDNSRYKWTGQSWQVAGKAERHVKSQPFAHPESPSTGQYWMQNPVSFYKLKLTNDISDQEGNIVLHVMHRYLPRLHVIPSDKAAKNIKLNGPHVVTFTFPQTEFMAVTAYQNSRFAQLKVDYNPFAKGLKEDGSSSWALKLKSITGKDSHKEGGTTTNEQHPVKKSLKSLLANHKPRSSKVVDQKPPTPDVQKTCTTDKDQSAAKATGESSCSNARPAQKLFSELIREAHVSLKRCNLEQLCINNSTSCRSEQTDIKNTVVKSRKGKDVADDSLSVKTNTEISSAKTGENVTKKNGLKSSKDDKHHINSLNWKDTVMADCTVVDKSSAVLAPASAVSLNSSVNSDGKSKPEAQLEENVKPHKRPAPLPLPALALFLKQHRLKPRQLKTRPKSPPALPPESLLATPTVVSAGPLIDHTSKPTDPSKDLRGEVNTPGSQASSCPSSDLHPAGKVLNVIGQATETGHQASSASCFAAVATTDHGGPRTDCLASVPVAESPEPVVPDSAPVLPNSDQPFYTPGTTVSTISSCLTTSSASPMSSPTFDTVLPIPNAPQTQTFKESTTLPLSPSTMRPAPLLPDSECSPFGFESLSPASSPEPLPSLPSALALELNPPPSVPTSKVVPPVQLPHSEDSAASVFKWHTVLPLPDPFLTTFTSFQPTPQPGPLLSSSTQPLLPSQTSSHPDPQVLGTAISLPSSDPVTPFQENDQSLPFPGELSPLVLQLPLSPTFSSLDGEGLSPTPSIADLVHFFSTDDDLGMEVDFSNTEAAPIPCPTPSTLTASAQGPSQQVQPSIADKPQKCKKKSRRGRPPQTDKALSKVDATDTSMQPNLEEVEEQLFVSFTSKEALRLHLGDSSEGPETIAQPQRPAVTEPQQLTEATQNVETADSLEERIAACEKLLLRDVKLMKHRQVIHPVLQEVGLKMSLLDPTQAIDLQYLGVHLPIPPPGVCVEPLSEPLAPPQSLTMFLFVPGVSAAFVSRTGKTTDVTQIKGWRDKFAPSEPLPTPSTSKPEAGPSSDVPKKNLSAFCSDMLDEYLENEGKLIDERAASFSQAAAEPVVYELPTRSTSYVRTLDSVLKKQTLASPTSALISGFVPPSKRPKLTPMGLKKSRRGDRKQKAVGSKQNQPKPGIAVAAISTPSLSPVSAAATVTPAPTQHMDPSPSPIKAVKTQAVTPPSEHTAPFTDSSTDQLRSKKYLKARATNTDHTKSETALPLFDHTAPITHDSSDPTLRKRRKRKAKASSQTLSPSPSKTAPPGVSEDMAPLESDSELGDAADQSGETSKPNGKPLVTKALLKQKDLEDGVVWEGRPRTCITEERAAIALTSLFTLMGFVCENPTAPIRLVKRRAPPCLNEFCRLGCVCVSLAHGARLTHCGRPGCMFGCSCLKQKVVLLKNLDGPDSSPSDQGTPRKRKRKRMKMAYVLKEADSVSQPAQRVRTLWRKDSGDRDPDPIHAPEPVCLPCSAESGVDDKSCARVRGYTSRKTPQHNQKEGRGQAKEGRTKAGKRKDAPPKKTKIKSSNPPAAPHQPAQCDQPAERDPTPSKRLAIMAECRWRCDADRNHVLKKVCEAMAQDRLGQPFWVKNYLINPLSQHVEGDGVERCVHYKVHISEPRLGRETPEKPQEQTGEREAAEEEGEESLEDWQREVEEGDIEEEEEDFSDAKEDDGREKSGEEMKGRAEKTKRRSMALPFLTGISPAGFLSASRKEPGGTDHLVQVNGKLYPLAKIQLGEMGALHPANRLAAYLTGRVGAARQQRGPTLASSSSSSSPSKPPQSQIPGPSSRTAASGPAAAPPGSADSKVAVAQLTPTVVSPVNPSPATAALNKPQVLMVQVPGTGGTVPVPGLLTRPPAPALSTATQRMVLQTVRTAAGTQIYRKVDGKLVQLVPVSQLRAVNPNLMVQRAPSSTPVLPISSLKGAAVSIGSQIKPLTSVTTTMAPTSLSGLQAFSVPPLPAPLPPGSGFLGQKGTCTVKIVPTTGNKEPIIVTCPKVPTQPQTKVVTAPGSFTLLQPPQPSSTTLISLKASGGQGAELGVKTVAVSTVQVGSGGAIDLSKLVRYKPTQASSQASAAQNPAGPAPPPDLSPAPPPAPPLGSEVLAGRRVTPSPHPSIDLTSAASPEPASDLVDLDIVCVDDEAERIDDEPVGGAPTDGAKPSPDRKQTRDLEVVDLVEESSDETDNSSDIVDDSDNNGEQDLATHISKRIHNALERNRRGELARRFHGLRKMLPLSSEKTPKINILMKAQQEIHLLRKTARNLREKKKNLRKTRAEHIAAIAQRTGETADIIYRKVQRSIFTQKLSESVSEPSEETPGDSFLPGGTGSATPLDDNLTEVVDLSEETEEQTDNSSDEENVVVTKNNAIDISNDDDVSDAESVESVDIETVEERDQLYPAQRKMLLLMKKSLTSDRSGLSVKKSFYQQMAAGFKALSSALNINTKHLPKVFLLDQACKEIQLLQNQERRLESLKSCLSQQRAAYIKEISLRSGKSEQRILRKLQLLSAKQRRLEQEQESVRPPPEGATAKPPGGATAKPPGGATAKPPGGATAKPPGGATAKPPGGATAKPPGGATAKPPGGATADKPPEGATAKKTQAGGAASQAPGGANSHYASSPGPPAAAPPQAQQASVTPSRTSAPPPAQPSNTNSQRVVLVPTPLLAPPSLSHNPSPVRDRPRTIPNILSRRKPPPPPPPHTEPVEDDPPSIQALVPAEVLSLVGASLPGQQVLTLSPLVPGPTLLQTSPTPGVASVTLNISNLTNQQIHLTSLPHPPPARNFPTMLHLVQPPSPQPQQQEQLQQQQQQQLPPEPPPPPHSASSESGGFETVKTLKMYPKLLIKVQKVPTQDQDQEEPLSQTQVHKPGTSSPSGPSAPGTEPSPSLGQSAGRGAGPPGAGPPEEEEEEQEEQEVTASEKILGSSHRQQLSSSQQEEEEEEEEAHEDSDAESLTSLLNELVFLNQQICAAEGGAPASPPRKPSAPPGQEAAGGRAPVPDLRDVLASPGTDSVGGAEEPGRSQSPLLLELDEDLSGSAAEKEAMLNGHTETRTERPGSGCPADGCGQLQNPQCSAKGGALTPPPLLQMKVGGGGGGGGATAVEPSSEKAGGREGGVAWRPMPRLVPLGLRSNQHT